MAINVDKAGVDHQHVVCDVRDAAGDDRSFLKQLVADLSSLGNDDVLLLVQFRIEQIAVLMVADALVFLAGSNVLREMVMSVTSFR